MALRNNPCNDIWNSSFSIINLNLLKIMAAVTDNFDGYNDGDLNGQGSWTGGTSFDVQGTVKQAGTKAVSGSGAAEEVTKAFSAGVATGNQQFYMRRDNKGSGDFTIRMSEGGTRKIIFGNSLDRGYDGNFAYYSGTGWTDTGVAFNDDTWYKCRIEWRDSDKKARYYVNDVLAVDWDNTIQSFTTDIDGIILKKDNLSGDTIYADSFSVYSPSVDTGNFFQFF